MTTVRGRDCSGYVVTASTPAAECRTRCFTPRWSVHFFAFFTGRSLEGGLAWAVRIWREFVQDGQIHSLTITERPGRDDRETAWREGLRRGARFLTEGIQPGRSTDEVLALTVQIGEAVGQPPVRPW